MIFFFLFLFDKFYLLNTNIEARSFHCLFAKSILYFATILNITLFFFLEEKSRSISEQGEHWCSQRQTVISRVELEPDTKLKLIRGGVIR